MLDPRGAGTGLPEQRIPFVLPAAAGEGPRGSTPSSHSQRQSPPLQPVWGVEGGAPCRFSLHFPMNRSAEHVFASSPAVRVSSSEVPAPVEHLGCLLLQFVEVCISSLIFRRKMSLPYLHAMPLQKMGGELLRRQSRSRPTSSPKTFPRNPWESKGRNLQNL